MEKFKYYIERMYPYLISLAFVLIAIKYKVNFVKSQNLSNVLDACNTVVALIIGFLGAILPVILGMKNESKIVKYVFERDKNRLFLKYIKATIFWGLITLVATMSMYLVNDYDNFDIAFAEFYVWIFLLLLFLLLTYRSLKSMLNLVFLSDDALETPSRNKTINDRTEVDKIEDMFDEAKGKL